MAEFVILKEFLQRHDAEMIKNLLEENGIKSIVQADDCGGLRPFLSFGCTIKLKVDISDAEEARIILNALEEK
ncbi:MAG TPA: DUF2007 domain-containing protein [Candidatus Omnitrophota bacterium]|nr:DUF2007 domain-containing protein [Candidatus Omnitrophota bacterium]